MSLRTDAALQALHDMGYDWTAAGGPWEWTYNGRRLADLRSEVEETD
jgi:hypothetical protein